MSKPKSINTYSEFKIIERIEKRSFIALFDDLSNRRILGVYYLTAC